MQRVGIIKTNAGNIRSVEYALQRQGVATFYTDDINLLRKADKLVLPGQGDARKVMQYLIAHELDSLLVDYKNPILGICVGLQVMCMHSQEGNTDGLHVFHTNVEKLKDNGTGKIPHIGWNTITACTGLLTQDIEGEHLYYVHSYCALPSTGGETVATTTHTRVFSAALEKDNYFAFQAHLEKSGVVGSRVIQKFLSL